MEPKGLLEKLDKEKKSLPDLVEQARKAEIERQTYLRETAGKMLKKLPEREDEESIGVDMGYGIANILAAIRGYKGAGQRISERSAYRKEAMEYDRKRRKQLLNKINGRDPESLHHLIAKAYRASTLRKFLNSLGRLVLRNS